MKKYFFLFCAFCAATASQAQLGGQEIDTRRMILSR